MLRPGGDCVYAGAEDAGADDTGAEVADTELELVVVVVLTDDVPVAE